MLIVFEVNIQLPVICNLNLLPERFEQILDTIRSECRLAKNAHDFEYRSANLEVVLDDGNKAIGDDGNVNLYADSVLGISPESFDLKVLLYPFEKQLHLPSVLIEQGNILCLEDVVVRVVYKAAMQFRGIIDNPSYRSGILLLVFLLRKADALVFEHVVCPFKYAF